MEFGKVQGKWAIAVAVLAALVVATAWQPAVAQDQPAAQEPPAKADQPAQPQEADKIVKGQPAQDEGKKADDAETVVVPGKKTVVRPPSGKAANVRSRGATPQPTVQLKPGEVPAIKFDTPTYNFGRVKSGTEITHDFWFTNTGTGPLEIVRAKPS